MPLPRHTVYLISAAGSDVPALWLRSAILVLDLFRSGNRRGIHDAFALFRDQCLHAFDSPPGKSTASDGNRLRHVKKIGRPSGSIFPAYEKIVMRSMPLQHVQPFAGAPRNGRRAASKRKTPYFFGLYAHQEDTTFSESRPLLILIEFAACLGQQSRASETWDAPPPSIRFSRSPPPAAATAGTKASSAGACGPLLDIVEVQFRDRVRFRSRGASLRCFVS